MLNNNLLMDEVIPLQFHLSQNYPNPFNEKTVVKYCVAYKTRVQLTVYDSEGKEIEKLVDDEKQPGTYEIEFKVSSCHSCESVNLPAGRQGPKVETYSYRLTADSYSSEKKMLLLK
jgi:hypothetical protein